MPEIGSGCIHASDHAPLVIVPISSNRLLILCSEEARAAGNGGLDAFARPSSQGVARGRAEILSYCSSRDAPRG